MYALGVDNTILILQVAPTEGTALLHLHGDKCLLHEARNVTKGVKYVFRSDVVFAWSLKNGSCLIPNILVYTSPESWRLFSLLELSILLKSKNICVILIFGVGNLFCMKIYATDNLLLHVMCKQNREVILKNPYSKKIRLTKPATYSEN